MSAPSVAWFIEYVCGFYEKGRPDALYPFATYAEIERACRAHASRLGDAFCGDTVDREEVRDAIKAAMTGGSSR